MICTRGEESWGQRRVHDGDHGLSEGPGACHWVHTYEEALVCFLRRENNFINPLKDFVSSQP